MEISLNNGMPSFTLLGPQKKTCKKLFREINSLPASRNLLIKALEVIKEAGIPTLRVDIDTDKDSNTYSAYGIVCRFGGTILIEKTKPFHEKRDLFLFHLAVLCQESEIEEYLYHKLTPAIEKCSDSYEKLLYKGIRAYRNVIKANEWQDSINFWCTPSTFDKFREEFPPECKQLNQSLYRKSLEESSLCNNESSMVTT